MAAWMLRLLGDFALAPPEPGPSPRPGRKGRALLACVAAQGPAGVGRGRLLALLWPDHEPSDARNALRQCLHQLRRDLGPAAEILDVRGERIVLRDDRCDVDLRRFEVLAASADPASMLAAATLFRGDFVDGLDAGAEFSRWADLERERLRDLAQRLLARLSEVALDASAAEAATSLARRLLAIDPVHEGAYRALMRLYLRAGLRSKAAQVAHECQRTLRLELGVEPSAQTAALIDALRGPVGTEPARRRDGNDGASIHADDPSPGRSLTPSHGAEDTQAPLLAAVATPPASAWRGIGEAEPLDLLLRGWQLFTAYTAEGNAQARACYERALDLAPGHADARAMLGWTHWFDAVAGWSADSAASLDLAGALAAQALAGPKEGAMAHNLSGKVLLWRMQHEAAIEHLRRAVALAPGSAYPHFHLGDATMWCGRHEEALDHVERAMRIEPNEHGVFLTIRGMAQWMAGDAQGARATLERALVRNPTYSWAHAMLAVVMVEAGELERARGAAQLARTMNRRFSLDFADRGLPFHVPAHRSRVVEAWRRAGMPEHELPLAAFDQRRPH